MESIKFWIISLCGAMAISAIFKLLLADSKLKRVINVFFSIFILFYTVIPTKALLKNQIQYDAYDTQVYYEQYYQDGYEAVIEQSITNTLNEMGVKVLDFEIDAYIDDEGYFSVNKIILKTNSKKHEDIVELIKNKLGFEVIVQ